MLENGVEKYERRAAEVARLMTSLSQQLQPLSTVNSLASRNQRTELERYAEKRHYFRQNRDDFAYFHPKKCKVHICKICERINNLFLTYQ